MKRILVIDDHRLIFDGLEVKMEKLYIIDYAENLQRARQYLEEKSYRALIVDISLGEEIGFSIMREYEIPPVFFLTMHCSSYYINKAIDMGAKGYFLKDEPMELLIEALKNPEASSFWMSDSVKLELDKLPEQQESSFELLTSREQEVFILLAQGLEVKEVALKLYISGKTVNNHRSSIMKKMGFRTQADLVKEAAKMGILSFP